jgi:hypothetical protein
MSLALRLLAALCAALAGCTFNSAGIKGARQDAAAVDVTAGPRDVQRGDRRDSADRVDAADLGPVEALPSCSDGVKNGLETDTDCGGPCATRCADGKGCTKHQDCASGICSTAGTCAPCAGKPLDGHCWYLGGWGESCALACTNHGGCDLEGTRDYAGSGGSDAQCVAVLTIFKIGPADVSHQSHSNNNLGCQHCWPATPYTYWSDDDPATCDYGYYPAGCATGCAGLAMQCQLVCACNQ